ncbi:MAG: aminopeptidase P family protein [Bacteroidetes bacterium]|nr:MAG: aminopeptidase P family protein [Bacteroidota bacterium]
MDFTAALPVIQQQLRQYGLDGWLLYNFRNANIFATKILGMPHDKLSSRRYFYFIPAEGTPVKLVHSIEQYDLDHLPGEKLVYNRWPLLQEGLRRMLGSARRVCMEYSPNNDIPYLSKVDAGTLEFIRSFGVEVVSSGNIVQYFEARWTPEQYAGAQETAGVLLRILDGAFALIGERLRGGVRITEYDVQRYIMQEFDRHGLTTYSPANCSVNGNGANPHYDPSEESSSEIRKGDRILIDWWAKKKGPGSVYADFTWVAYAGTEIPERYRTVFEVVAGARDAAVEYLRTEFAAGRTVRGCDVDDVTRRHIEERGFGEYFVHRTGHNIGEEVHGNGAHIDNFETQDVREIIPETCFSIEPGIYLPGEFGVRLEIDVYITASREVVLLGGTYQKEIVTIPC